VAVDPGFFMTRTPFGGQNSNRRYDFVSTRRILKLGDRIYQNGLPMQKWMQSLWNIEMNICIISIVRGVFYSPHFGWLRTNISTNRTKIVKVNENQ
jgi:hypothetical protein